MISGRSQSDENTTFRRKHHHGRSDADYCEPGDHLAAVGELMARAILRQRRGDPPATGAQEARRSLPKAARRAESRRDSASKMDLIADYRQSDTCAREAGSKVQEPGNGVGQNGLAENLHTGEEV